jgi:hypothetical protein
VGQAGLEVKVFTQYYYVDGALGCVLFPHEPTFEALKREHVSCATCPTVGQKRGNHLTVNAYDPRLPQ